MKMNEFKPYVIFFGIVAFIVFLVSIIREVNYSSLIKRDIKDSFRAIVVDIYNPREWIKQPNYMKVRKQNEEYLDIYLTNELLNYISIGDSLIKIKDENICYVKKPNGETKEFYYVRIPKENRNHWTFPKEWKNKWMESSAWDTLQR